MESRIMGSPASNAAIRVIREEHHCLAAVIKAMRHFARSIADGGKAPDLKVFRAMLLYICEYPEKIHHPKEDRYLFAPLRRHTNEVDEVIATLEVQHEEGEHLVRELEHALTRYELLGQSHYAAFHDMVEKYSAFYFEHMRMEEEVILPAAKKWLSEQEWTEMGKTFAENRDPLASLNNKDDFDRLFCLITTITPAPLGVGPALE
jgi:hemerythrin-like domain-containing protein